MNDKKLFSEEQLDFLSEMMNIGAGNAATALGQMIQCEVNVKIPQVHVVPVLNAPSVFDDPNLPAACVRMSMVGDVTGNLFFIVPDDQKARLIRMMEQSVRSRNADSGLHPSEADFALHRARNAEQKNTQSAIFTPLDKDLSNGAGPQSPMDLSVLTEVGNIIAGVYLTAIHDFCRLNIYHTVPTIAIDMIQSLLDESIAVLSREVQAIILIENEFIIEESRIRTFLLLIPTGQSVKTLVDSIEQARLSIVE